MWFSGNTDVSVELLLSTHIAEESARFHPPSPHGMVECQLDARGLCSAEMCAFVVLHLIVT